MTWSMSAWADAIREVTAFFGRHVK